MKTVTLGLLGKKGSGKGTVAEALAALGYVEVAFADPLYEEVSKAFNIPIMALKDRGLKETPIAGLKLTECQDATFYGIASRFCLDAQAKGGVSGWMTSGFDGHFHLSPRVALQLWGTEYRRANDNFYWVKKLAARVQELEAQGHTKFCISDIREAMEAAWVKRRDNGFVWKIVRPDNPYESLGTGGHSSEAQVDTIAYDEGVLNNSDIPALTGLVRFMEGSLHVSK